MTELLKNMKLLGAMNNGVDGNEAVNEQGYREVEALVLCGILVHMKPEEFIYDVTAIHGTVWKPHCCDAIGDHEESYRNLHLPASCNHVAITFGMEYNYKNFKAGINTVLTPIYATGVFQASTGAFCGFTPDSLVSPALTAFCCNLRMNVENEL